MLWDPEIVSGNIGPTLKTVLHQTPAAVAVQRSMMGRSGANRLWQREWEDQERQRHRVDNSDLWDETVPPT